MDMEFIQADSEAVLNCPHCNSINEIPVDPSVGRQQFIEECQVCSREIDIRIEFEEGDVMVHAMTA